MEKAQSSVRSEGFSHLRIYRGLRYARPPERQQPVKLQTTRVIQNSTVKIANGPLTCANAGRRDADKGLLNNPQHYPTGQMGFHQRRWKTLIVPVGADGFEFCGVPGEGGVQGG